MAHRPGGARRLSRWTFVQPWFWPAVAVIVGLPVVLLVLGRAALLDGARRGSPGAKIVLLVRNVLAPLGAILILFSQIPQEIGAEITWAKVAATAFGFVLILVLLNGLNLAVFVTAKRGTWRNRLPSIFVDIARAVLIVVALAILFGWIWGADIGGLFTALGISTIVIGLALQNAVGGVVAGLFLLFEQPFELGEYILTDWGKGEVVEINWRATHLDTSNGILVIPNGQLADSTFRNLSRSTDPYEASTIVRFATDDPPQLVIDLLVEVGNGLPELAPGTSTYAVPLDKAKYEVNIPLDRAQQAVHEPRPLPHSPLVRGPAGRPAPRPRPDRQLRDAGAGARRSCCGSRTGSTSRATRPRTSPTR